MVEKAKLIIEAYNRMGYDACAVAECDLVMGLDTLRSLHPKMKFELLCANLVDKESGKTIFPGSTVVERGGTRVGVIGLLMDTLLPSFTKKVMPTAKLTPPIEALTVELERLPKDLDAVFVLAHVDRTVADQIAMKFPQVDFILEPNSWSGTDAVWIRDGNRFQTLEGRVLLKIDGQGAHVGRLDVDFRERTRPWVPAGEAGSAEGNTNVFAGTDVELAPHIGRNPSLQRLVEAFLASTRFVEVEADESFKPSEDHLTADTCMACHPDQYAFWKTTEHASAYETLEKSGDEFRYDCIPCHVLDYGETFVEAKNVGKYKDVQCESCHGTNPKHPQDPAAHQWPRVSDKACWGCHNPRVTQAAFRPRDAFPKVKCPPLTRD